MPAEGHAAAIQGSVAAAHFIRSVATSYEVPVVLHTDHCAKKLLPWLDGMMDADEVYFREHGEPLFSSHMIDLSEESKQDNINDTAKYLKRAAPMKQWLEMVGTAMRTTSSDEVLVLTGPAAMLGDRDHRRRRGRRQQRVGGQQLALHPAGRHI